MKLKLLLLFLVLSSLTIAQDTKWRNIGNALSEIPDEGYCDQPYLVVNKQGEWVCVLTTGVGHEGQARQHIIATISKDKGKTWCKPIDIEPSSGPEASWGVPLILPSGRIYVFYTYNSENIRALISSTGKPIKRVDSFGKMMMKYSDDGGYTWADKRYEIPIRNFDIDNNNVYKGKIQFFWSVALPLISKDKVFLPFSKIGNFGEGFKFMESTTGAMLCSHNILTEDDPSKIKWTTLPEGTKGLPPFQGNVGEEHNAVVLSDGSLYCVYRTDQGYMGQVYSRDEGKTWTEPSWANYTPQGKLIKQPRCMAKLYKFKNGKYALFFHNNGAKDTGGNPLGNRNPAWMSGGVEKNGFIYWSQPELFLYDTDFTRGISYPDWIEDSGWYYFSETQKSVARMHHIPTEYMDMLWNQINNSTLTRKGLVLELKRENCRQGKMFTMPSLGKLSREDGFSLEFRIKTKDNEQNQILLDTRRTKSEGEGPYTKYAGTGLMVQILKTNAIEVTLDDGRTPLLWQSGVKTIKPNAANHIVVNVDAQAKILVLVINGDLCDGGERPFGFARFNPFMHDVNGNELTSLSKDFKGEVEIFRIYNRCLFTSEAIGNYRSNQ